ncbi:MAG TPA: ATP-binding cassette domain-containing protein, partial [Bordetella sp.]|nr:ATP-binding cassette domain-containing protein [Bordetella sp.]
MTAITISQLSKRYGGTTALRDLDLHVKQGELLTLLGPSGSGKSTTLALIAGLALPSAGTIFLGQRDVTLLPPAKRNIGL